MEFPIYWQGFENGANDYLQKPINREELLARVRTLVTLRKTVREHDEARYGLLQERMNPHFLFNALNTVHALISRDTVLADRALLMLAENYRFLIDQSFRSLIPFEMEWAFVENYLEFEELRFRDSLSVIMERQGNFEGVRIPPLILQPLVENALKHGVLRRNGGGVVRVCAGVESGRFRIIVRDNGPGLDGSEIFSRSLGNIRNRLNHYFHGVDVSVRECEEGGVAVDLSFQQESAVTV